MREIMEFDLKKGERIVTKRFFTDRVSIVSPSQWRYHGNRVIIDTQLARREVQNVKPETGTAKISPTTHLYKEEGESKYVSGVATLTWRNYFAAYLITLHTVRECSLTCH